MFCWIILETLCISMFCLSVLRIQAATETPREVLISSYFIHLIFRSLLSLQRQDLHVLLATIHMLVPYRPPKMADQAFAANKRSNMFLPNLSKSGMSLRIEGYWKILKDIEGYWRILKDIEGYWKILKDIEKNWKKWRILKVKLHIWNYLKPAETQRFFHRFSWWSDHRFRVSARGSGSAAAGGTFWGSVGERWWNIAQTHKHFEIGRETATETGKYR